MRGILLVTSGAFGLVWGLVRGNAAVLFLYGALFTAVFFLAQFEQAALGYGPLKAGLGLAAWTGKLFVVAGCGVSMAMPAVQSEILSAAGAVAGIAMPRRRASRPGRGAPRRPGGSGCTPLTAIAAFRAFQHAIGDRCVELPSVSEARVVGTFGRPTDPAGASRVPVGCGTVGSVMLRPIAPPGRPREIRIDVSVREAVFALLREHGYAGTTVDRIAARAGVGKGALYRRWRSKAEIVFAAVVHPTELGPPPDTGSLEGDLGAVAGIVCDRISDPTAASALAALALEIRTEPHLADSLRERLFSEERRWLTAILARARARGELRPGFVDPELVRQAIIGPIALAVLFSPSAPIPSADAVAGLVTRGLSA